MKYKKLFAVLCCLGILAVACKQGEKTIPVYNLDAVNEQTELKLTDLIKEIRIVPLETNDSIQLSESLSGGYKFAVTEKYILVLGDKAVYQFNALTGKFIRILATAGNGPQEYAWISSYNIDYNKNILYIGSMGKSTLLAIDFSTGEFLSPVPVPAETLSDIACVLPDGELCIPDDSTMFRKVHPGTGACTPLLSGSSAMHPYSRSSYLTWFGYNSVLLNKDEYYLFNQKTSDTLYKYDSSGKIEKVIAVYSDNVNEERTGTTIKFRYIDNQVLIALKYNVGLTQTKTGNLALLNNPEKAFLIHRDKRSIKEIAKFHFNPLFTIEDENISLFYKNFTTNSTHYAKILNAYKAKEVIERNLTDVSLPQETIDNLKELNGKLTENSNPVVIIGRKR